MEGACRPRDTLLGASDMERPHDQHLVILAEDFPKYMEISGSERSSDHGGAVVGSRRQSKMFSTISGNLGAVQDARIPSQQKGMLGFVTFVFADIVKHI
ncbi:hypothetical protein U1Q18_045301 [Sarracenia purpurea var. burkii]